MDGNVSGEQLLFRHPQRHKRPDDDQDDGRGDHVPCGNEQCGGDLLQHLHSAGANAVDEAP
uniref:Uncharacterized protein n=1 Tax=Oryza meridionalis TaxID=40149 RepID=A0A0E0F1I8_9ORYZ